MSENNKNDFFIKADNNILINKNAIRWIKKMEECMEVCAKPSGCSMAHKFDTISICKKNSSDSYYKLNKYYE